MARKEGGMVKILSALRAITYQSTPLIEGPGSAPVVLGDFDYMHTFQEQQETLF